MQQEASTPAPWKHGSSKCNGKGSKDGLKLSSKRTNTCLSNGNLWGLSMMHYTILNWLFWPCFTWFLGSCDTWFLCCSMPHQAAATCPLTISNSNANGKGSKHGLKLGSKRTSACTNMWKHVIINFWRTWKPTSDASWNLIWRMCHCAKLGGTCPQDCLGSFARLFLPHWSPLVHHRVVAQAPPQSCLA